MASSNHEGEPSDQEVLAATVQVCGYLGKFLDDGTWDPREPLEHLVLRTLVRGRSTFETIVDLVGADRSLQAAMLGRSLFEDMAVAHWLVLHRASPDWLIQEFLDHRDAMRLHGATTSIPGTWDRSHVDISDLAGREAELRKRFGSHAERDWWGLDEEGKRIKMPELVKRLAAAEAFYPRLRGEEPILEQYYGFLQKVWTQALHHTAAGMRIRDGIDGRFPQAVAEPTPFLILYGNYWVFGQLIYASLELAARAALGHFERVFLAGLAVFSEIAGTRVPWADELSQWAEEAEASTGQ